ncbi:flagellar hook-length control protein FliK [Parasphingorhabdus sp.]|uniref:flagellar hook-length control protein FliK n=1 Tax=Parasphingorhabdus sp. TaxID=2709688 RepID=UPI003001602C
MATPEQRPQATVDTVVEVGAPDQDERETLDAAAVPNWSAPIVMPAAIQNIGLGPWTRSLPSGTAEQQLPADETDILSTAAPIAGRHAALKPAIAAEPVDLVPSPLTQGDAKPRVIFDARAPLATGETPVTDDRAADEAQQSPLAARVQTSGAEAAKLLGHEREEAKNKGTSPALAASLATSETVRPLAASLSPLMVKRTLQSPAQDEAVTMEPQLPAKAMDVALSQPAMNSFSLTPPVRETVAGAASFDLSAPRLAERLAADETEILSTAAPIAGRQAALKPAIAAQPLDLVPSPLTQGDARPGVIFDARAPLATGETAVADDRAADQAQQSPIAARVQTSGADAAKLLDHEREEANNKGTSAALAASLTTSEPVRPLAASLSPLMVKRTLQSSAQDEAVTVEPQLPAKAIDVVVSQPAMNSFSLIPPVRETVAGAASFDLSAPRLAERLAAEISELSASGGTKKFEINPRNLGRMEIIFTTRGSTEIIEIQTENRSAKDIIMQHSQVLQDMLKAQGREDLSLRIDVKDSMSSFAKAENGNLFQQDSRDAREQQARPGRPGRTLPVFDRAGESDSASDNSRYA